MTYEELKKLGYDNLTNIGLKIRNRKFSKKDLPNFDFSSGIKTSKGIMYPPEFIKKVEEYFSEPTKKEMLENGFKTFVDIGREIGKPNLDTRGIPKELLGLGIKYRTGIYFSKEQSDRIKNYVLNLTKTEKYRKTVNEKYGVDNISQLEDIKKKKAETATAHYGTACSFKFPSTKKTIMKKYGVDNISKSEVIKKKKEETCLRNYGVKAGFLTEEAKKKIKDKYGVDNISQVPEIQLKKLQNTTKKYVYDGNIFDSTWEMVYYYFLKSNNIEFIFHPNDFLEYEFDGKTHRYFPDFKINDKYVEIKGDYWYSLMLIDGTVENAKLKCLQKNNVDILLEKDIISHIEDFEKNNGKCSNYRRIKDIL